MTRSWTFDKRPAGLALRCPWCGGALPLSTPGFTILRCCREHPVVAGIPVFLRAEVTPRVISLLKQGRHQDALLALIEPPSPNLAPPPIQELPPVRGKGKLVSLGDWWGRRRWRREARRVLMNAETACDLLRFRLQRVESGFRKPDQTRLDDYNYYAYRFGQPRDLVALSLIRTIAAPRRALLDLGCGCGHITRHLIHHSAGQPVIGLDRNFFLLHVAKRWIAPEASYVCAEADHPLPFGDGTFDAAVCSDAFHYFADKHMSIRELKRVTDQDGVTVLSTVRNAEVTYRFPGSPLTPEGYAALLGGPHRIVPDADILSRYLGKTGPALSDPVPVTKTDPLSVVLSHRADIFHDYGPFLRWPHAEEGVLGFNPLYTVIPHGETVSLTLDFPSEWYEQDNSDCKHYLWKNITAPASVLRDLSRGEQTPEIERLIDRFAVLGLPPRFGQPRAA